MLWLWGFHFSSFHIADFVIELLHIYSAIYDTFTEEWFLALNSIMLYTSLSFLKALHVETSFYFWHIFSFLWTDLFCTCTKSLNHSHLLWASLYSVATNIYMSIAFLIFRLWDATCWFMSSAGVVFNFMSNTRAYMFTFYIKQVINFVFYVSLYLSFIESYRLDMLGSCIMFTILIVLWLSVLIVFTVFPPLRAGKLTCYFRSIVLILSRNIQACWSSGSFICRLISP